MKRQKTFLILIVWFLTTVPLFAAASSSSDSAALLAALNSHSITKITNSAKIITRSGRMDEEIYVKAAQLLKSGYMRAGTNKEKIDELAWLCKVLASSGDQKYAELLTEVATQSNNNKLEFYANQSIELISEYAERNSIMSNGECSSQDLTPQENKFVNMIRSDNVALVKDAAKLIYRSPSTNSKVYEVVAEELTKRAPNVAGDREGVDALAWMCKALGSSGDTKHLQTLKTIATSDNWKLARNATEAIKMLR